MITDVITKHASREALRELCDRVGARTADRIEVKRERSGDGYHIITLKRGSEGWRASHDHNIPAEIVINWLYEKLGDNDHMYFTNDKRGRLIFAPHSYDNNGKPFKTEKEYLDWAEGEAA